MKVAFLITHDSTKFRVRLGQFRLATNVLLWLKRGGRLGQMRWIHVFGGGVGWFRLG